MAEKALPAYDETDNLLIRHDYKRACYRALLSEFEPAEIAEFFDKVPLIIEGRHIKGPELYKLLWSEKGKIPEYWDYTTDNHIERFLIEKGRDVQRVLAKMLWLNNQSTIIPGKVLLTWFYPKLESLFTSIDTRDMVYAFIALFTENWLPGHVHRRVKRWEEGEWIHSVLIFISDTEFRKVVEWDYEFIAGPQILNAPVMFGMPMFEGFGMIADTRPPETVLWEEDARPELDGDVFRIRGEAWGKRESFHAFCARKEIDLSKYSPPDFPVIVPERDYTCPIRKRVVLHKDVAYGAPVYMNWVTHRKLKIETKGILSLLVQDIEREETVQSDALEQRHQAMLTYAGGKASFVYHPADESITLNGQHLTKNVPAKILKYLVEAHVKDGKGEFEYRELKRQFDISMGQKNSNFEVRFARLVEKLKEECPTVSVDKTGRGKFLFKVTGSLEYSEA